MSELIQIFGRLHPLVLHLPIGILVYAFLMSVYQKFISKERHKNSLTFALALAAITSVISAGTGYLLSTEGGYDEDLLNWHKYLGIALAVCAVGLYFLYREVKDSNLFILFFSGVMILLSLTGHDGGSLTHGKDFLTADKPAVAKVIPLQDPNTVDAFKDVVMPIMEAKCLNCHNNQKMKGELLMVTIADWEKGGKNGPIFKPGDVANSHMLQRIHLPKEEKEHMPPTGKLQLENDEIKVLEWWISNMKNYGQTIGELNPNKFIMDYIKAKMAPTDLVAPLPPQATVKALRDKGYVLIQMSKESPWIHVDLSRIPVTRSNIKGLSEIRENIQFIDLSSAEISPGHLNALSMFTNLENLKLSNIEVATSDLDFLSDLTNLKSLNLYNTKVDDGIVEVIKGNKNLEKLYIWESNITNEGIMSIKAMFPNLDINNGEGDMFDEAKLSPPAITADKDIFADTMSITLNTILQDAVIRYTIDGTDPNSTSKMYVDPIVISATSEIKAIVSKDGWLDSEPNTKTFILAKYKPEKLTLTNPPAEKYAASGGKTLIDFVKGSEVFTDGNWLGFDAKNCTAIMDLGDTKDVKKIAISALEDYVSYIFYPRGVEVSASTDGKSYNVIGNVDYPELKEPRPKQQDNFLVDVTPTNARYLKIEIKSQIKNPKWHPAAGADSWLFIDEITVE